MGGKLVFVGGVILALIVTYIFITIMWDSVMIPAIAAADNATSTATAYTFTKAGIKMAPLWLYFIPAAVCGIAVVWKLRQPQT